MPAYEPQDPCPGISLKPPRAAPPDEASARQWCRERRIEDVECIIPDQAGVARGKLMPTPKFFGGNPMTAASLHVHPDHYG
jgi:glutamine synthetase